MTIREACEAKGLNHRHDRSCTDEDLCASCWMSRDVKRNMELYQALAAEPEDNESNT